jgi:hypothetical protein
VDGPDYLVSISGLRLVNARRNLANVAGGAIFTEHSLALDSMVFDDNVRNQRWRRLRPAAVFRTVAHRFQLAVLQELRDRSPYP